jgi:hypothetical protein
LFDAFSPDPVSLVDVGLGGFLVESTAPYDVDAITDFVFESLEEDWTTRLQARVVYCHERDIAGSLFMAGFAFVNAEAPEVKARIHGLIQRVVKAGLDLLGGELERFMLRHGIVHSGSE